MCGRARCSTTTNACASTRTPKRLVFSNALTFDESFRLYLKQGDLAQHGSGIGTWLTNDLGVTPLNIVMKLVQVNNQPVGKDLRRPWQDAV